jgi:hypothetical protein
MINMSKQIHDASGKIGGLTFDYCTISYLSTRPGVLDRLLQQGIVHGLVVNRCASCNDRGNQKA